MTKLYIALSLVVFLSACSSSNRLTDVTPAEVTMGLLAREGAAYAFTPCSEPNTTYVLTGLVDPLGEAYDKAIQQGYPGQNTVATLRARKESRGRMFVENIVKVQKKTAFNTCIPYDYWGLGNEPFWSLQISKAEDVVEFGLLGEKTVAFEYKAPSKQENNKLLRYLLQKDGQRMKVDIRLEECYDTMAGNRFPASVTVNYRGQTYTGCALPPESR